MTTLFDFLTLLGMAYLVILALGICVIAFWTSCIGESECRDEIIEREIAPPEPVHPDLLDEIVRQGGYDIAKDREPFTDDDMEAVREACRRVSG